MAGCVGGADSRAGPVGERAVGVGDAQSGGSVVGESLLGGRAVALAQRAHHVAQAGGAVVQDVAGDGAALVLVGVEQGRVGAVEEGGELPAEVVGVLDAGVHALAASRGVDVRRVACQEDAPGAVVVGQDYVDPMEGVPFRVLDDHAGDAGAVSEDAAEQFQ